MPKLLTKVQDTLLAKPIGKPNIISQDANLCQEFLNFDMQANALSNEDLTHAPRTKQLHQQAANAFLRADYAQSSKVFSELLNLPFICQKMRSYLYFWRAYAYLQDNQLDLSLKDFKQVYDQTKAQEIDHSQIEKTGKLEPQTPHTILRSFFNWSKKIHSVSSYLIYAQILSLNESHEKALAIIQHCLKKEPDNLWCLLVQAKAYQKKNEFKKAIAIYNQVLARKPELIEIHYRLGYLHFLAKEYFAGLKSITHYISLQSQAKTLGAYYVRGQILYALKQPELAIQNYTICVELNPLDALYYWRRAKAALLVNDFHMASMDFIICNRLQPKTLSFVLALALAYIDQKLFYQAGAWIDKALNLAEGKNLLDVYSALFVHFLSAKHYRNALTYIDKLLANEANDVSLLFNKAIILLGLKRRAEADDVFQTCSKKFGNTFSTHFFKAKILLEANLYEEALVELTSCDQHYANSRQVFGLRIIALTKTKRFEAALFLLEIKKQVLASDIYLATKIEILFAMGNFAYCLKELETLVKTDQDNCSMHYKLAQTYFNLKKFKESKSTFEQVAARWPGYEDTDNWLTKLKYLQNAAEIVLPKEGYEQKEQLKSDFKPSTLPKLNLSSSSKFNINILPKSRKFADLTVDEASLSLEPTVKRLKVS